MRVFEVQQPGDKAVSETQYPSPEPAGNEVVVSVTNSGVCHTDVHVMLGGYDLPDGEFLKMEDRGVRYPLVMGHETAGIVTKVGPEVTDLEVGQQVVIYPWLGCGTCEVCATGAENSCPNANNSLGIKQHGGYASELLVPHEKYCVDLQGVDPSWGATLACSGITSYSAAKQILPNDPEAPVLVCGAGGVGLTAIATLHALGHRNISVIDRSSNSLELATKFGARKTVQTSEETTAQQITDELQQSPVAILDFVNSGETASMNFELLSKGGTMVQIGLFGGGFVVSTAILTLSQKTIKGSYVGSLTDLQDVVTLAAEGKLPEPHLQKLPLSEEQLNAALSSLVNGEARGRTVLQQN